MHALKKDCPDVVSSWAIHPTNGRMLFLGGGETCPGVYQSSRQRADLGIHRLARQTQSGSALCQAGSGRQLFHLCRLWIRPERSEVANFTTNRRRRQLDFLGRAACEIPTPTTDDPNTIYCGGSRLTSEPKIQGDAWQVIPGTQSMVKSAVPSTTPRGQIGSSWLATNVASRLPHTSAFSFPRMAASPGVVDDDGLGSTRADLEIDPADDVHCIYLATYYSGYVIADECRLYRSDGCHGHELAVDQSGRRLVWSNVRCGPCTLP